MDFTDNTDIHFGLIPLDPARNNDRIEPRTINHATPSQNLTVYTDGDSWVEWGEPRAYDPEQAPDGIHIVNRVGYCVTEQPWGDEEVWAFIPDSEDDEDEPDGAPCCMDPECGGNPCTFPGYADNH